MPDIDAETLVAALRTAGLRVTRSRRAVCEVLAVDHDRHLTVATLHPRVMERLGGNVDRSTVYRTIDALEDAGLVHHVHLGHGPSVLHLSDHVEHHHLTCEVCGATRDVPFEELSVLTDGLGERYGFSIVSAHFALIGRCSDHADDSRSQQGVNADASHSQHGVNSD